MTRSAPRIRARERRCLALAFVLLLADLSIALNAHRHVPQTTQIAPREESSTPPAHDRRERGASLDAVCAICGVLSTTVATAGPRIFLDPAPALDVAAVLPVPALLPARVAWASTASRAPPIGRLPNAR